MDVQGAHKHCQPAASAFVELRRDAAGGVAGCGDDSVSGGGIGIRGGGGNGARAVMRSWRGGDDECCSHCPRHRNGRSRRRRSRRRARYLAAAASKAQATNSLCTPSVDNSVVSAGVGSASIPWAGRTAYQCPCTGISGGARGVIGAVAASTWPKTALAAANMATRPPAAAAAVIVGVVHAAAAHTAVVSAAANCCAAAAANTASSPLVRQRLCALQLLTQAMQQRCRIAH